MLLPSSSSLPHCSTSGTLQAHQPLTPEHSASIQLPRVALTTQDTHELRTRTNEGEGEEGWTHELTVDSHVAHIVLEDRWLVLARKVASTEHVEKGRLSTGTFETRGIERGESEGGVRERG